MDNYIAIVVDSDEKAFETLHALWGLDDRGDVTVHGAAVIHRTAGNDFEIATKQHVDTGVRTVAGALIGAVIGALAGPAGSAVGIAAGAGAGGVAGLTADAVKFGEREEAEYESGLVIKPGQAAVLAEVSEDSTTPVDSMSKSVGGTVYRRPKSAVRDASEFGDEYIDRLVPYDYDPQFNRA